MRTYEILFIIDTARHEGSGVQDVANEIRETIEKVGGEVLKLKRMGSRKLAFPIKKRTEGYYYLIYFNIEPSEVNELNRVLRLNNSLLRFLITQALPTIIEDLDMSDDDDDEEFDDDTSNDDENDDDDDYDDDDDDYDDE